MSDDERRPEIDSSKPDGSPSDPHAATGDADDLAREELARSRARAFVVRRFKRAPKAMKKLE
jgi:hypothetical protein